MLDILSWKSRRVFHHYGTGWSFGCLSLDKIVSVVLDVCWKSGEIFFFLIKFTRGFQAIRVCFRVNRLGWTILLLQMGGNLNVMPSEFCFWQKRALIPALGLHVAEDAAESSRSVQGTRQTGVSRSILVLALQSSLSSAGNDHFSGYLLGLQLLRPLPLRTFKHLRQTLISINFILIHNGDLSLNDLLSIHQLLPFGQLWISWCLSHHCNDIHVWDEFSVLSFNNLTFGFVVFAGWVQF